ncbi:MAG: hypothetical protein A2X19_00460 [Bacteroidetes bacterium GWE2_39_28]|nr:MAG: hypothetical protein A2X19_00460 [Bacteroidetes bacterium GWE2_39_28]OFY14543.1 MAG: hypothetical protein A2X16_09530 [Bacteroidetes bacterium GWF2_39_10]OFZ08896.1 MAG: hypothetical protein A2322_00700 [Bacteroidetes bacterium RIFOXYB2_FULL_39_7]OFZ10432.1 MAG: hypothetical protein A2465_07270 [Bacteroidetes bacterium RIFOXYC2_FULL_39_11]
MKQLKTTTSEKPKFCSKISFLPRFCKLLLKSSTQRQHLFSDNFQRLLFGNDEDCLTTEGRSSAVAEKYQENLRVP